MTKEISLTKGYVTLVDDEDYDWLSEWKWCVAANPRTGRADAVRAIRLETGKQAKVAMHRVIMSAPDGMDVDHINRDTLDNRRTNLRLVTRAENLRNRKVFRNNSSGHTGVVYNPKNMKWKVVLNLGTFETSQQAAEAYDRAISLLFGNLPKNNL